MSIANIKELFSKRVRESVAFNNETKLVENGCSKSEAEEDEDHVVGIKEIDVGITEYLNDIKGFNAVIKQRFSDFQVHEIDSDGNVVYLTNTDIPVVKEEPVDENILSNEIWEKLTSLKDKVVETVEIDVTDFTKAQRNKIHKAIKSKYKSLFNSNTVSKDGKSILRVTSGKNSRKDPWFIDLGSFLHFVLYKVNLGTSDAINIIASKLKTKSSNLTYAGTKDKRAKTCQWVSMRHLDARRLNQINESLREMRVGNYVYKSEPLKLGDLKGNLFEIALRNVTESDEVIDTVLNKARENGFINYFGLQRFGNCAEVPTYEVGKALCQGDFQLACELILKPRKEKTKNDLREARKVWWETRDAVKALKCLSSKDRTIEGKLLYGLAKHGKNAYVNALDNIPRNVRLLYLHSYQSYIWNKVLSKRIKHFGKSVIEGDLVFTEEMVEEQEKNESEKKEEEEQEQGQEEEEEAEKMVISSNELETSEFSNKSVRHLTLEEVDKYQIWDVVQPLPGHNVTYPKNVIKDWYEEFLQEDNLSSEQLKQKVKQYSLSGTQRLIVQKLKDLSWNVCYYSSPEEDLILSDLDKLNGVCLNPSKSSENQYKAVVLKFSLDSSTYATMALREILKIDTSASHQTTLNSYSNKRTLEESNEEPNKKSKVC